MNGSHIPWQPGLPRAHRRFLDYVGRHAEAFDPATFAALDGDPEFYEYGFEPWPLFLGPGEMEPLSATAEGVAALVKAVPERVFGNDPARLAEYYGMGTELAQLLAGWLTRPGAVGRAVARGDFIASPAGLRCLELNVAGNLGGSENGRWAARFLALPLVQGFLAAEGLRAEPADSLRSLFEHVVAEALAAGLVDGGSFHLAITFARRPSERWHSWAEAKLAQVLAAAAPGIEARVSLGSESELEESQGRLSCGGNRVHALLDTRGGAVGRPVFVAHQAGSLHVYNGPPSGLLSDKRNLALLSELEGSDLWSAEERRRIAAAIPWTRRVEKSFADRGGERVYLPDLLRGEREALVLKQAHGFQGEGVFLGRSTPPSLWDHLVRRAIAERDWIVQERVESIPYPFLDPPTRSVIDHDLIWGIFTFGSRAGGTFLRLAPRGGDGVINAERGAKVALALDLAGL